MLEDASWVVRLSAHFGSDIYVSTTGQEQSDARRVPVPTGPVQGLEYALQFRKAPIHAPAVIRIRPQHHYIQNRSNLVRDRPAGIGYVYDTISRSLPWMLASPP